MTFAKNTRMSEKFLSSHFFYSPSSSKLSSVMSHEISWNFSLRYSKVTLTLEYFLFSNFTIEKITLLNTLLNCYAMAPVQDRHKNLQMKMSLTSDEIIDTYLSHHHFYHSDLLFLITRKKKFRINFLLFLSFFSSPYFLFSLIEHKKNFLFFSRKKEAFFLFD